jgi:hypothetical protein
MKEKIEQLRPYVVGAGVGIVVVAIVAFSAGWITLMSSADQRVAQAAQQARVDVLATICAEQATQHRVATNDTRDLSGWQNRQAREDLARQFAAVLSDTAPDRAVIQACARELAEAA